MILTFFFALNSCVIYATNFFGIKKLPLFSMKCFKKIFYVVNTQKVNESITNITIINEINWEIKKIIFTLEFFVDCF